MKQAFHDRGSDGAPRLAPGFCQVAWVVRDMAAAEAFFTNIVGVKKFIHIRGLTAKDNEGTYRGKPGGWVMDLALGQAGETQIELIRPVSGESIYKESLERHGDAVQHVAYWLDDSEYDAAAKKLTDASYPLVQSLNLPIARIGYFDTRPAIGVMTELFGANALGHAFRKMLRLTGG